MLEFESIKLITFYMKTDEDEFCGEGMCVNESLMDYS